MSPTRPVSGRGGSSSPGPPPSKLISPTVGAGSIPATDLQRIVVLGTSGSGKTYLAQRLAGLLDLRCVELDALHWAPDWVEVDNVTFRRRVAEAAAGDRWVVDGNYSVVRDLVWPRAQTVIWLNYSFALVFGRVLRRTLGRVFRREVLFSGNRESLRMAFCSRDSILLWVLQTYGKNRRRYGEMARQSPYPHLRWVEFRRPREVEDFLSSFSAGSAAWP